MSVLETTQVITLSALFLTAVGSLHSKQMSNCVESVTSLCSVDTEDSPSGIHTGFFFLALHIILFHSRLLYGNKNN